MDGFFYALIKVFGLRREVEIAIQANRVIAYGHALFRIKVITNEGHDRTGEALQSLVVGKPVTQHRGGNRKQNPGRSKAALGQNVMNEEAVNTTVAIIKWMNEHESKGGSGSGDHRIDTFRYLQPSIHLHP